MWAVGAIFAELLGLGPLFAGENDIDQLAKASSSTARWPGLCLLRFLWPPEGSAPQLTAHSVRLLLGVVVVHAQVQALLGTLDEEVWPGVKDTPDFGKISFPRTMPVPLAEALPDASATAISLLGELGQSCALIIIIIIIIIVVVVVVAVVPVIVIAIAIAIIIIIHDLLLHPRPISYRSGHCEYHRFAHWRSSPDAYMVAIVQRRCCGTIQTSGSLQMTHCWTTSS